MQTVKSVFGVTRALLPVLYCGGLLVYFFRVGGSVEGIQLIGLGPTFLGLGAVGFLFCIPLIMKVMRIMPGPRPPISGGGPSKDDDDSGFDADAAIARYMASKRAAEAAPSIPAPRPAPKSSGYQSSGPAKPAEIGAATEYVLKKAPCKVLLTAPPEPE